MSDIPSVDLTTAAKVVVRYLDGPLNPEITGPLIELWMSLFGFTANSSDPTYEEQMMEAVRLAFDLADPVEPTPPARTVAEVIVEGEVL